MEGTPGKWKKGLDKKKSFLKTKDWITNMPYTFDQKEKGKNEKTTHHLLSSFSSQPNIENKNKIKYCNYSKTSTWLGSGIEERWFANTSRRLKQKKDGWENTEQSKNMIFTKKIIKENDREIKYKVL